MGAVGNLGSEYCHKCQTNCSEYNYGPCVFYRGPEIPTFFVKDWKNSPESERVSLQEVLVNIGVGAQTYIENNYVSVDCAGVKNMLPGPAAALALSKLCNLNTDNIGVTNALFCLGKSSSVYTLALGARALSFSVSPTPDGHSLFSYNLEEALNNLPDGYMIVKKEVEVFSYNPKTIMESRLVKTADTAGQFQLKGDMYPLGISFKIDVGTPGGLVTMSRQVTLDAPREQMSPVVLEIEDKTSKSNGAGLNQTMFNALVESALCNMINRIDSYRSISLAGCDDIKYFDKSVQGAVGVHAGHLCSIYNRLNNIGKEKIKAIRCDENCEKRTYDTTIQERSLTQDEEICGLKSMVKDLTTRLEIVEEKLRNCCRDASAGSINS